MRSRIYYQIFFIIFLLFIILLNVFVLYNGESDSHTTDSECGETVVINVQPAVNVVSLNMSMAYQKWGTLESKHVKMLGYNRPKQSFLTLGIPSIQRINGMQYLLETIQSLNDRTSESDKLDVVVVVFLADFDVAYNQKVIKEITNKFIKIIELGFLQIIQVDKAYYPSLENLKRNFQDGENRVRWRAKQVLDYSLMFMYAQNISQYYIQIEDDVEAAANFVSGIKTYINAQRSEWVLLEFSELGFIGKLFKSKDLPKLAKFMMSFYEDQPVDWLLTYFRLTSAQSSVLLRKPTLFQHMGLRSSFDITSDNKLKDRFFDSGLKRWQSDDPSAVVITNMEHFQHWTPDLFYASGGGFFWAKDPQKGDEVYVIFDSVQNVLRIAVESGNHHRPNNILYNGVIEISPKHLKTIIDPQSNATAVKCADWKKVAEFKNGIADTQMFKMHIKIQCIKILLTEEQEQWIIFNQLVVFLQ